MKRFTIVTRPYLLEDLQRASYGIFKLLESYLGGSAAAYAEPLDRIRLLRGSIDLDQQLRNDVFAVLTRIEGVGLQRADRMQLGKFRKVIDALLEWPEQVGGTKLWIPNRPLDRLIRDPDLAVEVRHPDFECYTVPIKRSPDMKTYWLATESYWQAFSTPGFSNILYLESSEFGGSDFIELRFGRQQYRARYQKMALQESPLGFPDTPYHQRSELAGSFFREVRLQDRAGDSNAVSRDLIISAQSDREEFDRYPTVGWLNPLIFTFDLDANDIPVGETEGGDPTRSTIATFLDPSLLVRVEPHIGLLDSYRFRFLESLNARQRSARQARSAVEALLWGSAGPEPWKSFFLLDRLGGEFVIDNFGRTEKQFPRPERLPNDVRLLWKGPHEAAGNRTWWQGQVLNSSSIEQIGDDSPEGAVLPPSDMPGFGSSQGFRRVDMAEAGMGVDPTVVEVIRALRRTGHESATRKVLETMLLFAADFLDTVVTAPHDSADALERPYFGEGSFQRTGRGRLQFDELSFLEQFSAHYLAPISAVYAVLPTIEQRPARIDIVSSVPYGRKEFFRRIFAAGSEQSAAEEIWERRRPQQDIVYRYGWWQEWFELLFAAPSGTELHFVSDRDGFIVARSLLGRARLGRAAIGRQYDVTYMRI